MDFHAILKNRQICESHKNKAEVLLNPIYNPEI